MTISPAQSILAQSLAAISTGSNSSAPAPAANPQASAPQQATPPAAPSPFELSTSLQIDDQHQVYYEFVNKATGDVVFEIPPEALRAIAESLNLPLEGEDSHNLDVTS